MAVKSVTTKVSRPGVHSKTKTSKSKKSKNYKKNVQRTGEIEKKRESPKALPYVFNLNHHL